MESTRSRLGVSLTPFIPAAFSYTRPSLSPYQVIRPSFKLGQESDLPTIRNMRIINQKHPVKFVFVELPVFTKLRPSYLSEDQYRELQRLLLSAPDSGALIQQTGGLRKLRFHEPRRQKGKRGGIRIIYYWFKDRNQIWLFTVYSKGEMGGLTHSERNTLRRMLRKEIDSRLKCHE